MNRAHAKIISVTGFRISVIEVIKSVSEVIAYVYIMYTDSGGRCKAEMSSGDEGFDGVRCRSVLWV